MCTDLIKIDLCVKSTTQNIYVNLNKCVNVHMEKTELLPIYAVNLVANRNGIAHGVEFIIDHLTRPLTSHMLKL